MQKCSRLSSPDDTLKTLWMKCNKKLTILPDQNKENLQNGDIESEDT